jgi:hypothetical protein
MQIDLLQEARLHHVSTGSGDRHNVAIAGDSVPERDAQCGANTSAASYAE